MEVSPDRTMVCGIERHTFKCSDCAHTAKRDAQPIEGGHHELAGLPPETPIIDPPDGRLAAQAAWARSIEKVNNKQAELKQRAAEATDWSSVVEKLGTALKQQAGAARAEALGRVVEKVRGRQTGLPARMSDGDFEAP